MIPKKVFLIVSGSQKGSGDPFRPEAALQPRQVFHNGRGVVFAAGSDNVFFRLIKTDHLTERVEPVPVVCGHEINER